MLTPNPISPTPARFEIVSNVILGEATPEEAEKMKDPQLTPEEKWEVVVGMIRRGPGN